MLGLLIAIHAKHRARACRPCFWAGFVQGRLVNVADNDCSGMTRYGLHGFIRCSYLKATTLLFSTDIFSGPLRGLEPATSWSNGSLHNVFVAMCTGVVSLVLC